jgi:glycosyltransferase involved in cell wall biosynthesis
MNGDGTQTGPRFSIITPVFNPPRDAFEECVRSVFTQTHEDWQWCLVDDHSTDGWVQQRLSDLQALDHRIRVHFREENGGIVAASNDALSLARGDFVAFLDHDDALHPEALEKVHQLLLQRDEIDYVYTDEDKIGPDGKYYDRFEKPKWSPERLLGQNYCSHLSVIRKSLVDEVGRFRQGFDGSQDYDLLLRVTEKARDIVHIPEVLYHWRAVSGSTAHAQGEKPYAYAAAVLAVNSALQRRGSPAAVTMTEPWPYQRVLRSLAHEPRISIIIPTCGTYKTVFGVETCLVINSVESILTKSAYENFEILVVIDDFTPNAVWDGLRKIADSRLKLIPYDKPFNFASKCNLGAVMAAGEYLLMLNDDTEITDDQWLHVLAGYLEEPDVAMVGPMLLLEDGRIQSAGHANNPSPHNFRTGSSVNSPGEFGVLTVARECSGITGACALIRKSVYEEVGGMSPTFPRAFNDVDFAFKILEAGYRIIWTPHTQVFHFETASRPKGVEQEEVELLLERWSSKFDADEYCRLE